MKYYIVISVLEKELREYERGLDKSFELFDQKKIDIVVHTTHKNNLIPKIEEFKTAIEILKNSES